ncbi:RNA 2',3'-cyclic phosphodiesterase [Pontibacter sp. G13]|uniref:RNA 2',3'-cyclic phosphodiesterase n=1 Tax=Pontibacter sp. G13 TaxID=3074898 RepID=UPI00288AD99D|nr:RNA 2',3'-cyclic phosphodiesterase [Pontibacter sp. G13]WNJ17383.1 RNA 2',3'-cyclic phosphodiesterase [Pontibacter sp. G13]
MRKRLFIGIPIPEEETRKLVEFQEHFGPIEGIRWQRPEKFHITVYFFGSVATDMQPNLEEVIRVGLKNHSPFTLPYLSLKWAPKPKRPRMIWAQYQKEPAFMNLVADTSRWFKQIQPDHQHHEKPIPHITLARYRDPKTGQKTLPPQDQPLPILEMRTIHVKELIFWSSKNLEDSSGSVYFEERRFSLS